MFARAEEASAATRKAKAEEAVNLLLQDYAIEKIVNKDITFMDYFGPKVGTEIDGVTEDGNDTYTIEKDGYYFEIIDGMIEDIYDADIIMKIEYPYGTEGPIARAKVTVGNNKKGVDTSSIEYGWTTSREETPTVWLKDGIENIASGVEITKDITGSTETHFLHVRAKAVGETEYREKISNQFNDIDETEPTISLTGTTGTEEVTITGTVTFGFSGGKTVKWLAGEKAVGDFAEAGTEITLPYSFTVNKNGWYTVYVEGNNGKKKVEKIEITTIVAKPIVFNYTGDVQEWVVPETANYRIEVWGASAGGFTRHPDGYQALGGYSAGTISLISGTKLYLVVGGMGGTTSASSPANYSFGGRSSLPRHASRYPVLVVLPIFA